jgi:hypothetical protein
MTDIPVLTTQKFPRVAVVILNYNGMKDDYLPTFLPAVYASTYPNFQLVVADNASEDNSLSFLESEGFVCSRSCHNVQDTSKLLIKMDENYWFAGGYNRALSVVEADYYVLLNSDVQVGPQWIEPIIEMMESDAQIAACQPKVRMQAAPYLFEHAGACGGWIDKYGYPFCRGRLFMQVEEDRGQYDNQQEVFWASGAALFIQSKLFHAVGGFDEDYQAHMEEIDLCWRLKRANYKIMVCPQSVVWHVGGGTLPKHSPHKAFLNFRNSLSTVFKNTEGKGAYFLVLIRLFLDAVAGLRFMLQGEWANVAAIVKAHWSFFAGFSKLIHKKERTSSLVEKIAYQQHKKFRQAGLYSKSIVWQHFVKGKNTFQDLDL